MTPIAKALNILQAEAAVHMGWLVPTITLLRQKLDRLHLSFKLCLPPINTLQAGIQLRFGSMFADLAFIAAAILLPKLRTTWTTNEDNIKMGLDYMKSHIEKE